MFELWHFLIIIATAIVIITIVLVGLLIVPYFKRNREESEYRDMSWSQLADSHRINCDLLPVPMGPHSISPYYYWNESNSECYYTSI